MISLRSKVARKILTLLFLNEEEKFYVSEMARIIKENVANVHKKLIELKKEGLLSDEFQGKERFFFLNKKCPFLKEYKKIVLKGFGFEKNLEEELKKIKGIDAAYIFGSYARDKLSLESDIDLLLVGDFDVLELQKTLLEIQRMSNREINSMELTKKEFQKRKKEQDPFLEDIFSQKYIKVL